MKTLHVGKRLKRARSASIWKDVLRVIVGMMIGCGFGNYFLRTVCQEDMMLFESNGIYGNQEAHKALEEGFLYIAVMTNHSIVDTKLEAVVNTWMKDLSHNIRVEVFVNSNEETVVTNGAVQQSFLQNGVSVIKLPGLSGNTGYLHQKKSFLVLKFIHEMYSDRFDWYIYVNDVARVNMKTLWKFLSRINSSEPRYIGRTGFAKDRDSENYENHCMADTGIIFSNTQLRMLRPKLQECMENLITPNEDMEIGRCVRKAASNSCTFSLETISLFSKIFKNISFENIPLDAIEKALVFHYNQRPYYQYAIRSKLLKLAMESLKWKILRLEKESRDLTPSEHQRSWTANCKRNCTWSLVKSDLNFETTDRRTKRPLHPREREFLIHRRKVVSYFSQFINSSTETLVTARYDFSYYFLNPVSSVEAVTKLWLFIKNSTKMDYIKRKTYIHQKQHFLTNLQFINEPREMNVTELISNYKQKNEQAFKPSIKRKNTVINFVLALSGRTDIFAKFLKNFEDIFLKYAEAVNLWVAYFPQIMKSRTIPSRFVSKNNLNLEHVSDADYVQGEMDLLQSKYADRKLKMILLRKGTDFSRGVGLQEASKHVNNKDEILFFCDVDLVFTSDILLHIRENTVQGQRVYYPVFFSQYDPDVVYAEEIQPSTHFRFKEADGFWRYFSYGMFSIYKGDFARTNGFDPRIKGWGLEDYKMIDDILKRHFDIFRCYDPSIVHIYHDKYCDPKTTRRQYHDCLKSRVSHFGPKAILYQRYSSLLTSKTRQ